MFSSYYCFVAAPGMYEVAVPLILNDNTSQPYSHIQLSGELLLSNIEFEPEVIIFNAAPLDTERSAEIQIHAKGYKT